MADIEALLLWLLFSTSLLSACELKGIEEKDATPPEQTAAKTATERPPNRETTAVSLPKTPPISDRIDEVHEEMAVQQKDGLRIEWKVRGEGLPIQLDDVVMVNYTARVATGRVYDSNKKLGSPIPLKSNIGMLVPGWEQGLLKMREGDRGRIMIPATLGYGEKGYAPFVPPHADIIVDIEIVSLIAPIVLEGGVKVYKWQTAEGVPAPKDRRSVSFHYFAYRKGEKGGLYANSYERGTPFRFHLGDSSVTKGLEMGISLLKVGENAFIEVPSELAYGTEGMRDMVPPNTDVVYDVRIESIE